MSTRPASLRVSLGIECGKLHFFGLQSVVRGQQALRRHPSCDRGRDIIERDSSIPDNRDSSQYFRVLDHECTCSKPNLARILSTVRMRPSLGTGTKEREWNAR